eukprot:SAG31_NODE_4577_length_3122_cov_8.837939_1_plen_74_part_10
MSLLKSEQQVRTSIVLVPAVEDSIIDSALAAIFSIKGESTDTPNSFAFSESICCSRSLSRACLLPLYTANDGLN